MTKENLIKLWFLLAIAAAVGVAGCGDDEADGNEGVTTSSLNKTAYVKQANKICTEVDKRIATKVKPIYNDGGFTTKSYSKSIETVFIPESEAQIDRLTELGAPAGDEDQIEAMLAALQQDLDEASNTRKKTYETLDPKFDQSDELARSYGLTACATF